ncbi:MAG: multidrug efflux SMR transporter [Okeania sp. SIO3B5]|uniref:DMT family transporter n=1 Tax=Okeania sp. SIO3B5 TaxID=2607811 RepID=UPI0014009821|nr:multidrug efflux SMR transporter [Okeania sp. SIO3B5]NEO53098.1 multidrug efflux SMR transporter [Okeania sp. SIO3B5]
MWGWLYLMLSIGFELAGSTCLKLSEGFTKKLPSILLFLFYGLCFYCLGLAVKTIDISVAYATWAGLGTTATVIIGIIKFKESVSLKTVLSIAMIVAGVVILELFA